MNVTEVRALAPEADVYSLTPEAKYLIVVDKDAMPTSTMQVLAESLMGLGIAVVILAVASGTSDSIKLYEDAQV